MDGRKLVGDGIIVARFKLNGTRAGAVNALREYAQGAARKLCDLFDARDGADGVDVLRRDLVLLRVPLGTDEEQPVRSRGSAVDRL